jgi:hypothetical protein
MSDSRHCLKTLGSLRKFDVGINILPKSSIHILSSHSIHILLFQENGFHDISHSTAPVQPNNLVTKLDNFPCSYTAETVDIHNIQQIHF